MFNRPTAEAITDGVDLNGKTALVTGVNSGIGHETMRVLALRGATVVGTARTMEKAQAATSSVGDRCIPLACELTDLDDIRRCAAAIDSLELGGIDIVVANAGIMALPSLELIRGVEKQFATNHLGHFLLVNLLIPMLTTRARVVIVSSAAHRQAPSKGVDFDNLDGSKGYSPWTAYGQSKLANISFALGLAERLPEGMVANALHPGVIRTNLGRNMGGPLTVLMGLAFLPFMTSIEKGAATSCYVAAHPDTEAVSGAYFADCKLSRASMRSMDKSLATHLWSKSCELVDIEDFSHKN